jgi:hypothetical protein
VLSDQGKIISNEILRVSYTQRSQLQDHGVAYMWEYRMHLLMPRTLAAHASPDRHSGKGLHTKDEGCLLES